MKPRIGLSIAASLLAIVLILFVFSPAKTQGLTGPVQWVGPITPTHCAEWVFAGYIEDSGAGCGGGGGSGTVTSFSFTNGNGFSGTVTTPTTTPALALSINGALPLFGYATASLPTCNSSLKGAVAYVTDGTTALTYCNGTTWVSSGTTPFTIAGTGCTPTSPTGDATGGSFTLASGPCTSVTVTFNGAVGMSATHLWDCSVGDQTLQAAGTWFGRWLQSSSTTATVVIPIPSAAGSTDVITFSCSAH